jgi:hypothetical protein
VIAQQAWLFAPRSTGSLVWAVALAEGAAMLAANLLSQVEM